VLYWLCVLPGFDMISNIAEWLQEEPQGYSWKLTDPFLHHAVFMLTHDSMCGDHQWTKLDQSAASVG
jgi:hypothetical protein